MNKFIFPAIVLAALLAINAGTMAQNQTYTITNGSNMVVTGFSISPNDANKWSDNLNTTGNITANSSFQFTQPVDRANCLYDIRYMTEDGTYYYIQDVDMCTSTSLSLTAADSKDEQRKELREKLDDPNKK
jgi:hypothetical protein